MATPDTYAENLLLKSIQRQAAERLSECVFEETARLEWLRAMRPRVWAARPWWQRAWFWVRYWPRRIG
jgi:hypothetical protein